VHQPGRLPGRRDPAERGRAVTAPYSQGKPLTKGQAAGCKAKSTDRRSFREVKDEFMKLFPDVSEEQIDGLTLEHMEKRIQGFHRLHRPLNSKVR